MELNATVSERVPEAGLAQLPALAARLADMLRTSGFAPDVIAYVERGARLLAHELCHEFGCGAVPLGVQRRGGTLKKIAAVLLRHLPRSIRDILRRLDERWFWSRESGAPRDVTSDFTGSLAGHRVLLVDDAADSGRTIAGCLTWLNARGVPRENVRVAVLAATTPAGRRAADFWLLERNTRLPWSSDSTERAAAEAEFARRIPPPYAPRDL